MHIKFPSSIHTSKQQFRFVVRVCEKLRRKWNAQKRTLGGASFRNWKTEHGYPRLRVIHRKEQKLRRLLVGPAKQEARNDPALADIDLDNAFED